MISVPVKQAEFSTLPATFRDWLDFYDSLDDEHRQEPLLEVRVPAPSDNKMHEHHIQRDFCLARVAEALLPSRFTRSELHSLSLALHEGHKYTTTVIPDEDAFLKRAWQVAR
jgi:hypothetical protein